MTTQTHRLTVADYAALDEPEDEYVTELVRGVVVREPRPRRLHGLIQVEMAYLLRGWAKEHGAEVTAESGYILSEEPATVRGPDVAVVLEPRPSEGQPGGWVRDAPDVAVEVLSPSDTSSAMQQKTLEYLESGAQLVWIVDPEARTVTVHRPDGSANILREHETLTGEGVMVDFAVEVREIFEG